MTGTGGKACLKRKTDFKHAGYGREGTKKACLNQKAGFKHASTPYLNDLLF